MTVSRIELIAGAGLILITAVGVARIAMPDRPPLRRLSIEGLSIPSETIGTGQTLVREAQWRSTADVYVMGWSYSASPATSEVRLEHGSTILFFVPRGQATPLNPTLLPSGTGYRLPANEPLTLRMTSVNTGPAGETNGVRALIYFVPVAGN